MKRSWLVGLVLVSAVVASAGGDDKKTFQALYDTFGKHVKGKNLDGLKAMMAPKFSMTENGMTTDAKQSLTSMQMAFSSLEKITQYGASISKVTVQKDHATVNAVIKMVGNMKNPQTGKVSKLEGTTVNTDTWVKLNGKWLIEKVVVSKSTATVDGKPIGMGQ